MVEVVRIVALLLVIVVVPARRPPGPGNSSEQLTFYGARAVGDRLDAAYQCGNRTLVYAVGVGFHVSTSLGVGSLVFQTQYSGVPPVTYPCQGTAFVRGHITVPAFQGSRSSGALPAWGLIHSNASGGIVVNVVNGVGTVVTDLFGPGRGPRLTSLSLPSTAIDCPTSTASLLPYDGPFLSRFSSMDELNQVVPANGTLFDPGSPMLSVGLWGCSSDRTGFAGSDNMTSGTPVSANTFVGSTGPYGAYPCRPTTNINNSISNDLGLSWPYVSANPTSNVAFRINITSAAENITWSNLSLLPEYTSTPGPPGLSAGYLWVARTAGWSLEALGPGNVTTAIYNPNTWNWSRQNQEINSPGSRLQIELGPSIVWSPAFLLPPFLLAEVGGRGAFFCSQPFDLVG